MAIITISRQLASYGDEIGSKVAEILGYKFFGKKDIEKRIIALGFPESKLSKFDDRKIGFLAGLTRSRDEYLNYLMTAILETASENNCVIVGRGSFIILKDLANHVSCRFIADENARCERIQDELNINQKASSKKIAESEARQKGFHKEFFNFNINDPAMFDLIASTSKVNPESIARSVVALTKEYVTPEREEAGQRKIDEMLIGQRIVDILTFIYNLEINFLRASIDGKIITLHGIASTQKDVDAAVTIVEAELPNYQVKSSISVARDYKAY